MVRKITGYLLVLLNLTNQLCCAEKPSFTVMVNITADNDLFPFAAQNMRQMERVGSNEQLNIIVQVIERQDKKTLKIERYQLLKNSSQSLKKEHISNYFDCASNLIRFCTETIEQFPAEHYALVFWNHGTGTLDSRKK